MTIAEREQQILPIKKAGFQSELDEHLESLLDERHNAPSSSARPTW